MRPTLQRALWRSLLPPAGSALLLLLGGGSLLEAALLLLRSPATPSAGELGLALLALLPALLPLALPAALLVGSLSALARWRELGAWTALRAAGLPGRALLPPLLALGLLTALLAALSSHLLAPWGQRSAARALDRAAARVELRPGRFVELERAVLLRRADGSVYARLQGWDLLARDARLEAARGGWVLELERGAALGPPPEAPRLGFEHARIPIPRSEGRRVELEERSTPALASLVRRMRAHGRDASYEATVLAKRSTLPLLALLLPFLALPLGLGERGRPSHALWVLLGTWALVRAGDRACRFLGPLPAASLPLLGLALLAGLLWLRWEDA